MEGTNDFSFSGIKTALLRMAEGGKINLDDNPQSSLPSRSDAAASFQKAVIDVLVTKTIALAKEQNVNQILVAGGVAANKALRQTLIDNSPLPVLIPSFVLCTDNAAMIAACAYYRFQSGKVDGLDLDAIPNLKLA
jgi:N6-L-threonylcarbamoyladenine synthase